MRKPTLFHQAGRTAQRRGTTDNVLRAKARKRRRRAERMVADKLEAASRVPPVTVDQLRFEKAKEVQRVIDGHARLQARAVEQYRPRYGSPYSLY